MAANMINIATVYGKLNNYKVAYKNINDALEIYHVFKDKYNTAASLNEKGKYMLILRGNLRLLCNCSNRHWNWQKK